MDILIVEDDKAAQKQVSFPMKRRGHNVVCVETAEAALELLETRWFPMAFLDLNLPGMGGIDLCGKMRESARGDQFYIVVGTSETGPEKLSRILDAGADDYIAKPYNMNLLGVRLQVAEKRVRAIEEKALLQAELEFLAKHDPLTRLLNRWQLDPAVEDALKIEASSGEGGSLMLIDLDHFKQVNDTCGHQTGDRLLVLVANTILSSVPEDTKVVRYGGDEFVAVLPTTPSSNALEITESISSAFESMEFPDLPPSLRPSASIGITTIRHGIAPRDLLKEADTACYRAKSLGKNRAEVFVDFNQKLLVPRSGKSKPEKVEGPLPTSDEYELVLWFQPVCDMQTGCILFQEALLRYQSKITRNAVTAGMFKSQVNDEEYVAVLDRYVAQEMCNRLREHPDLTAAMNVNANSINDMAFADYLLNLLDSNGIDGKRLYIEITESSPIRDMKTAEKFVIRMREHGIRFAIDDLGAGYASIATLKSMPIELVKIDGSLIRELEKDSFNQYYLDALRNLAKGMGFHTIAERIETMAEMEAARGFGINYGQGYLIARPRELPFSQNEISASLFPSPISL